MNNEEQLGQLFRSMTAGTATSFLATVMEVNSHTVDVKATNGTLYLDVQLQAGTKTDQGMLLVPTPGSTVLVSRIDGSNRLFVSMFSEIETVMLTARKLSIQAREVVFNDGDTGMVYVNRLTQSLNRLVTAFNTHAHLGSGAGTPASPVEPFSDSDYQNIYIKH